MKTGDLQSAQPSPSADFIPTSLKVAYTAFLALLVPIYWVENGPENFLWFSDIALLLIYVALFACTRLLASMMALSVLILEIFWNMDFLWHLFSGSSLGGLAAYMFDPAEPLIVKGLSFTFHVALPLLIVWLLYRCSYQPRALFFQCLLCWAVLPISYFASNPEKNINWVHRLGSSKILNLPDAQHVIVLMFAYPLIVYLPSHYLFKKLFSKPHPPDSHQSY